MKFLKKANLPDAPVGVVCINRYTSQNIKKELLRLGLDIIESQAAENMISPVRNHTDIVLHHLGDKTFVAEPGVYSYFKEILYGGDVLCGKQAVQDKYPNDCFYNVARIADTVFLKVADDVILDFDNLNYTKKIYTRQGYCKCNICVVSENAFITSDEGIYKQGINNGFDVLKINSGHIDIDGYEYGFIGGASGLIAKDILAFCGDVSGHPDHENIKSFLRNYNVYIQNLSNSKLFDIGSVIPIAYK